MTSHNSSGTITTFLLVCLFIIGCQNQPDSKENNGTVQGESVQSPQTDSSDYTKPNLPEKTEFGSFSYKLHRSSNLQKPYPGAFVQYHYTLKKDGETIQSSFGTDPAPIGRMPTMEELKAKPTPIQEGLLLMSVGDSISISAGVQSDGSDYIYELVLLKIIG